MPGWWGTCCLLIVLFIGVDVHGAAPRCLPQRFAINHRDWRPVVVFTSYTKGISHYHTFNVTLDSVPCRTGCCEVTYVARRRSSDLVVLYFLLIRPSEIHHLADRTWGTDWVLDAGANIGVFSAQLCLLAPDVPILAVELDRTNFRLLKVNTAHCRRIRYVRAALWGESASLGVQQGHRWGPPQYQYHVEPVKSGPSMIGVTIEALMKQYGIERFQMAKIDIEGAEKSVFSSTSRNEWLGRTHEVMVEIHDDACKQAVHAAFHELHFTRVEQSPDKETWRAPAKA